MTGLRGGGSAWLDSVLYDGVRSSEAEVLCDLVHEELMLLRFEPLEGVEPGEGGRSQPRSA
jgi:hypothetical protein